MSRNSNEDFDDILVEIAKRTQKIHDVDNLGKKLGFIDEEIARYKDENTQQGGSYMGTLNMLRTWRRGQIKSEQRKNLKAALMKAGFKELANDYFSAVDVDQQASHAPPAPTVPGASSQSFPGEEGDEEVKPVGKDYFAVEMTKATPTDKQLDPNKNYRMDVSVTKGHMFIFNMSETRKGSDLDVGKIKYVFNEIGFKTKTYSDLTAEKFEDELEKFVTSPKHKGMCSAVFVIMAHGNETVIQCKNKQTVTMKFIMDKVNTMKHMNGKPKIIFFQCCRGGKELKKLEMDKAGTDVPAKSDVLRVYATTDGNGAYRDPDDGTWFIQMLCEELLENAHVSDLCTMLEQVTGKVAKMDSEGNGQCVEVVKQGISKKIYLLPKYSKD